jgi:hypothetical protein
VREESSTIAGRIAKSARRAVKIVRHYTLARELQSGAATLNIFAFNNNIRIMDLPLCISWGAELPVDARVSLTSPNWRQFDRID